MLRHNRAILLVAVAVTVVAGVIASRLTVNADLRVLLPADHRVVRSLEQIEESFGSTNSINFLAKGGTVEARHAFTDALEEALDDHPLLRDVEHGLPSRFFAEHALYYLDHEEMEELDFLVEDWLHFELASRTDDFLTEPNEEAPENLRKFIVAQREEAYERTGFHDRYEREGVEAEVLLAYPIESAAELAFADEVTTAMREVAEQVYARRDAPWAGTGLTYNILGPYITKTDEQRTVTRDVVESGLVGLAGVLLVLYLLFRSQRAVLVLLVPLTCGVVWTLGATQLVLGRLNVMTSLISTVVMGVGIDAGIHFFSRMQRLRREQDNDDAIVEAFRGLAMPLFVASSTTVCAFASMAASDFPAFREFGIIAALGVALCLTSMVSVLPALAKLVGIKRRAAKEQRTEKIGALTQVVVGRPMMPFLVLVAVTGLAVMSARAVGFEYNARRLQSDHAREKTEPDAKIVSGVFGKDIHSAVLVRDSLEEVRETLDTARARLRPRQEAGESNVAELFAVTDLLPPPKLDLQERYEEVVTLRDDHEDLIETLQRKASENEANPPKDEEDFLTRDDVDLLEKMLDAQPFGIEDLPRELLAKVRAEDGSWGIFAYPSFDVADMKTGLAFMRELETYVDNPEEGIFVGEAVLYAAMFLMLREEAPIVLALASVLIAALVFWQLRSLPWSLMTLLPLALSMLWLVAMMVVLDVRFSLFNLPILPAILGIGVDNGVYLSSAIRKQKPGTEGLWVALAGTGGAILAATATTAVGFAAFLVANSGGVRGIGEVAVIGICLAAAAAILVLPTVASLLRRDKQR